MKTKLMICLLAVCGIIALQACDNDNDDPVDNVSQVYVDALKKLYPAAVNVKWENKAPYRVAEFSEYSLQIELEVWFDVNAAWVMTELDYGKNLFELPTVINGAFTQTEYCRTPWTIEDIKEYKRPSEGFFLIEVEAPGRGDVTLLYRPDGSLARRVAGEIENIRPEFQL